jgi:hypothetical protein
MRYPNGSGDPPPTVETGTETISHIGTSGGVVSFCLQYGAARVGEEVRY